MTGERAYRFLDTTLAVTADRPAALSWLDEFLAPAFERAPPHTARFQVRLRTETAAYEGLAATRPHRRPALVSCFALDRTVERRPSWEDRGRVVVEDEQFGAFYVLAGRGVEVIAHPGSTKYRSATMRVIREIATARAMADPRRLQLHAAALVSGGRAILLAGPKESGKTTVLVHLAITARAPILTNDRAILSWLADGVDVRGVPTIVSLRPGTLALAPTPFGPVPRVLRPAHLTLAEAEAAHALRGGADLTQPLRLSPAQLARGLDVGLASNAPLAAIAFVERHPDPGGVTVARLVAAEAERQLRQSRFGLHSARAEATVFERFAGAIRGHGADEELIARLAAEVPSYALRLGGGALGRRETAESVLTSLSAIPGERGEARPSSAIPAPPLDCARRPR